MRYEINVTCITEQYPKGQHAFKVYCDSRTQTLFVYHLLRKSLPSQYQFSITKWIDSGLDVTDEILQEANDIEF